MPVPGRLCVGADVRVTVTPFGAWVWHALMSTQAPAARTVTVRNAAERDLPAIQVIYAHHVLTGVATFEEIPPSVEELRSRHAAVIASGLPFLVAESLGEVVGYAYATTWRSRPAYRYAVEDSVYVAPARVGQGIGAALLRSLIARCEAGPWRQMLAVIAATPNPAPVSLHRRAGFALAGTLASVGFKHGRWVDTVLMQRALGEGGARPPTP